MPTIPIQEFGGIDNLHPPFNVAINNLLQGENIYTDDARRYKRRDGYTLQIAGDFHSIWNDIAKSITLVVEDTGSGIEIQKIAAGFTQETLVSGITNNDHMSFVETVRDTIIYSNGADIGQIVNGVSTPFVAPTETYKMSPIPGGFLAWLRARLYIASNDVLWFTDAYTYHIDKRNGFAQFSSQITMLQEVDDGLYVSDSEKTYFLTNDPPSRKEVHPYPAIQNTAQLANSELFNIEGLPTGRVLVWASKEGLVVGGNSGIVFNVTRDHYTMPIAGKGGGLVAKSNGNYLYVVNLFN
jgi:hypothetical protein